MSSCESIKVSLKYKTRHFDLVLEHFLWGGIASGIIFFVWMGMFFLCINCSISDLILITREERIHCRNHIYCVICISPFRFRTGNLEFNQIFISCVEFYSFSLFEVTLRKHWFQPHFIVFWVSNHVSHDTIYSCCVDDNFQLESNIQNA